jgi:hypothetical protein
LLPSVGGPDPAGTREDVVVCRICGAKRDCATGRRPQACRHSAMIVETFFLVVEKRSIRTQNFQDLSHGFGLRPKYDDIMNDSTIVWGIPG